MALDLATIAHALDVLEKEYLGSNVQWVAGGTKKKAFFELYPQLKDNIKHLRDLRALASTDWVTLNNFLTQNRFDPMFDGPLDGIGAVSILDMLVEWLTGTASLVDIDAKNRTRYPGFELPKDCVQIFKLPMSVSARLIGIKTISEDFLWILDDPDFTSNDPFELWNLVYKLPLRGRPEEDRRYSGARLPMVDFNIKPDISFLVGTRVKDTDWYISEAHQQFKFRMNQEGARARVATGIGMRKGISIDEPIPYTINHPFIGWFTQKGTTVPLAVFYADYDSWREPKGSLKDM